MENNIPYAHLIQGQLSLPDAFLLFFSLFPPKYLFIYTNLA